MQVTSHWLSDTGLLLLRCVQLLFFAVTLTLEGTTGEKCSSPTAPVHGITHMLQLRISALHTKITRSASAVQSPASAISLSLLGFTER